MFSQTKDFTHEWSTTIELADCRRHMKTRPYNSPRIHILLIWLLFSLFFDSTDGSLAKLLTNSDNSDLYVKRKEFVFVDHRQWTMRGSSMAWTNSKEHGTHFNMLSVVFDFVRGEKVLISKYGIAIEHMKQKEKYHSFSACVDAGYDIKESITDIPRDIQQTMQ